MGIPYYFAFLVKNYPEIMGAFTGTGAGSSMPALYIDANSIVYDVVRDMGDVGADVSGWAPHYDAIIAGVIRRLRELIAMVGGKGGCDAFIAFDGVAPRAKMEQQRQRRARMGASGLVFITPGTDFMCKLNVALMVAFGAEGADTRVTVSGSDAAGEGEHKIFAHIRERGLTDQATYVYGLDADLIILSLLHLKYAPHLYLLREKNQMVAGIVSGGGSDVDANTLFMLNIRKFAGILTSRENLNIDDYIFMSFFLGNDFMPHFPALNIRTAGIDNLMWAYKQMRGTPAVAQHGMSPLKGEPAMLGSGIGRDCKSMFVMNAMGNVNWENVHRFITILAQKEADWFLSEHLVRDKMEAGIARRPVAPKGVVEDNVDPHASVVSPHPRPPHKGERAFGARVEDNHAILNRETEKYIAPQYPNWEQRYYLALFSLDVKKGDVVQNWLEGLEWCLKYYMASVPSWEWMYHYNYPPLLVDIAALWQDNRCVEFEDVGAPCSPADQLVYIMPKTAAPEPIDNYEWSYCRYMWESHAKN